MELSELKRINKIDARTVLQRPIDGLDVSEYKMAHDALEGMETIRLSNRKVVLPGLHRWNETILKALAGFAEDRGNRLVKPVMYAKADDIVIEPLRPEQFVAEDTLIASWIQLGLAAGEVSILPSATQVTAGATVITCDKDELFIFTDFIEMKPAIRITAIQGEIDGTPYKPLEMRLAMNETDLQMYDLDYPWICDVNFDIDAKCEYAGDSELTPFGVHICLGKLIADLTTA